MFSRRTGDAHLFDDFLIRAFLAGAAVALAAGPLGCFVVWRRMSYFGDTIAHGALPGVALAAPLFGLASVTIGLAASATVDTPSGPSIVAAAFAMFLAVTFAAGLRRAA